MMGSYWDASRRGVTCSRSICLGFCAFPRGLQCLGWCFIKRLKTEQEVASQVWPAHFSMYLELCVVGSIPWPQFCLNWHMTLFLSNPLWHALQAITVCQAGPCWTASERGWGQRWIRWEQGRPATPLGSTKSVSKIVNIYRGLTCIRHYVKTFKNLVSSNSQPTSWLGTIIVPYRCLADSLRGDTAGDWHS